MATYSLSGSGTHSLTSNTTGLQVTITTASSIGGVGRSNPVAKYDQGLLRFSDSVSYWPPVAILGGPQFVPVPQNATSFGYALLGGAVVSVTEVIGGTLFFSGGTQSVETLSDVQVSSIANGQVLEWNASASKWENVTPSTGSSDLVLLDSVELGSTAATIVLSASGGSGYRNLRILGAFSTGSGTNSTVQVNLRFNADATNFHIADCTGINNPNRYSPWEITVFDFLKTDRWKAAMSWGYNDAGSAGDFLVHYPANWNSTAAVTSLTLATASGTFQAGSTAHLYGLK